MYSPQHPFWYPFLRYERRFFFFLYCYSFFFTQRGGWPLWLLTSRCKLCSWSKVSFFSLYFDISGRSILWHVWSLVNCRTPRIFSSLFPVFAYRRRFGIPPDYFLKDIGPERNRSTDQLPVGPNRLVPPLILVKSHKIVKKLFNYLITRKTLNLFNETLFSWTEIYGTKYRLSRLFQCYIVRPLQNVLLSEPFE